jgi:putative ABC transport system permease protein
VDIPATDYLVIIDKASDEYMWGQEPYRLGRTFQINDRPAVLVGVCKVGQPFFSDPIIYARYSQAARYVPRERRLMNYVLVKPRDGVDQQELCRCIEKRTGRMALTRWQFFWKTVRYFLDSTGIPINFGITIALGFIVGAAVTGQTLYRFVLENLKQFGALKAMGIPNGGILKMILLQSLLIWPHPETGLPATRSHPYHHPALVTSRPGAPVAACRPRP